MKDNACFYIKHKSKDQDGREFAMSTVNKDKYAPKTTGIHNVEMSLLNPSKILEEQKFFYKSKT